MSVCPQRQRRGRRMLDSCHGSPKSGPFIRVVPMLSTLLGWGRPPLSGAVLLLALATATAPAMPQAKEVSQIAIDYPAEGSVFPPDIAAPTFLWRDADPSATSWRIEFAGPQIASSGA